jgi:23S rRNA (cytidine1920-2'-O)/16S rRNA (cytidine1409-2'-O)-methyltransferase
LTIPDSGEMADHSTYVSRGGMKLAAALDAFGVEVAGAICVDLGANVGGFTDCLLQRGAAKVYAIDTGYGELAWKLRNDERVAVHERTNALHVDPAELPGGCVNTPPAVDLVVIDLGWTRQQHAIAAALKWRPGRIITLIKPHYEAPEATDPHGTLDEAQAQAVVRRVLDRMPALGVKVIDHIRSPILGGKGKGRRGNTEFLALVEPT